MPCRRLNIAWNTNLAYLQADEWSGHACRAVAMRDTDLGWMTKIVAVSGGPISTLADLKIGRSALGSRTADHAAILPVHFLRAARHARRAGTTALRFNSDLGKHGDNRDQRSGSGCAPSSTGGRRRRNRQPLLEHGFAASAWCPKAACVRYGPRRHTTTAVFKARPHLDPQRNAGSRSALCHELRQPDPSPIPTQKGFSVVATSRRWLRRIAASRRHRDSSSRN